MQYYAKVGSDFFLLFSLKEGQENTPRNNFMKWSISVDPDGHKKIVTREYTVHDTKIAVKTIFPKGTRLIGDYKGKETGKEYETLHRFGYHTTDPCLVSLVNLNENNGFVGRKTYQADQFRKSCGVIEFPDDPCRPYWISSYFTNLPQLEVEALFTDEMIDHVLFYEGVFGNFVTLLKFVTPEWERMGVEPEDKSYGWIHETFFLSKKYEIYP